MKRRSGPITWRLQGRTNRMGAKNLTILISCVLFVYCVLGKPIKKEKEPEGDAKDNEETEYLRYLGQVS